MDGMADLAWQERCIVSKMHEDMRERMTRLSQSGTVASPLFLTIAAKRIERSKKSISVESHDHKRPSHHLRVQKRATKEPTSGYKQGQ